MKNDNVMLPQEGNEQDSKVTKRANKDWVPHEAKQLFASLILQVTQAQLDEERARETELYSQWADMPLVAREFHRGVDVDAPPVGEAGRYEVTAVGDDGAVSFREKAEADRDALDI